MFQRFRPHYIPWTTETSAQMDRRTCVNSNRKVEAGQGSIRRGWRPQDICCHCRSVTKSCLTIFDPMDHSTPGFPVLHHLLEFAQIHVHWVGDAIQPSHPLLPSSPHAFNLSQHQGLFQWVSFMEYYWVLKMKAILSPATPWMNLEDIMLSEMSPSQKDKYWMILLIGGALEGWGPGAGEVMESQWSMEQSYSSKRWRILEVMPAMAQQCECPWHHGAVAKNGENGSF